MHAIEKIMNLVLKPKGDSPIFYCMLLVNDLKNNFFFEEVKSSDLGTLLTSSSQFKTGSITKPFTAAVIFQLFEEGLINLDDLFLDVLDNEKKSILSGIHIFNEQDYSSKISIRHLLQHRSGLLDYFADDDRFRSQLMQYPADSWNWKRTIAQYFKFDLNKKSAFEPGNGFYYSDTNYLLLALLIEHITNQPLFQCYEERILRPLGLHETYLEYDQVPNNNSNIVYPFYGKLSLQNVNTSFDWGAGGLISTLHDLDIFIRSLINGQLFKNPESINLMLQFVDTDVEKNKGKLYYGLGLQKKVINGYTFIGHTSSYGSMMFYEPNFKISIVLTLNQSVAIHKAGWMLQNIIKLLLPPNCQ